MNFVKSDTFKKYFVPGIVFQSVVIAGGYGTGRELVEFFLNFGTLGGLIAMVFISTVIWSLVCAATFEFARVFKAYDYRSFFTKLLGKAWWLYEVCYFVLLLIVLAVIASTAGSILNEIFGLNYYVGVIGMMVGVGLLVFNGSEAIEKFLSYWSFLLYAVYIAFLVICFTKFGDGIVSSVFQGNMKSGWALGGFKYAFYNLGIIPAVLFSTRHIETRKEAIGSGIMAGIIGIIPGILLYLAMIGLYPDILTFAVTERINSVYKEKGQTMPTKLTTTLTIGLLIVGAIIAQFGLIGLIAKGYGTITWGFFIFYVVPVCTIGVWKIMQKDKALENRKVG